MRLTKWIVIGVIVLPAAELALVLVIAALLGWPVTLILLLATSVAGMALLRRAGRADIAALRPAAAANAAAGSFMAEGRLHLVLAGILLLFPGFITDLLGVLTLIGPLRRRFGATFGRVIRRPKGEADSRQRVIDLEPGEWHQVADDMPQDRQPRRRR
jgi:UPF0716 protein FxsA